MKSTLFVVATLANIPLSLGQSSSSSSAGVTGLSSSTVTSAPSSTSLSTTREPTTATVKVGVNHDFQPDTITALPGDVIKFIFYPTNHSVVRAAYENPCIPYNYVVAGGDTFFSGPKVSSSNDNHPEWSLTVNDTEPYFFYCSAPGSCIDSHMVGVINPNENYTLEVQKDALQDVKFQLSPGEPWPAEASSSSAVPTSSATSTSTGPSSSSSAANNASSGGGTSLSGGAIAGIAIGGTAVLIIIVALIWFCGRKGGIEKGYRKSTIVNPPPPSMMEANYGNQPKSPPPPTYRDSPYGSQAEAFRSTSPAQWSQTGSPHNSYAGYPSPGLTSPWSGVQANEPPKPVSPGPVEMMGDVHHPGSPPPGRHEFPG